jgi:hypothetical protein
MDYLKRIFSAFCFLGVMMSCQKIDGPAADIFKTWEVNNFVAVGETVTNDEGASVRLTLSDDSGYDLDLGQNLCSGEILNITDKYLMLGDPGCTEICCDSPFAKRFAELIPAISMYKISGDILRLYVDDWGFIECKLVE